jgi:glycosyltransferase involved in cell wall biosynthesis
LDHDDPRLHFVWIGSGADTYLDPTFWCVRDARRAGVDDRIHFLGEVEDTEQAFRASDMYLLTSREDPFPCVVHEAMACGMPVACFDGSGGSPSMLRDGGGEVIPFGDVQGMADAVITWLDDEETRARIGLEAKRIVEERYDQNQYVKWLMELGLD